MYSTFFELYVFSLGDISSIISLQPALKFNGGGHINHSIFWTNLSPDGGGEPTGEYLYKKGNKKEDTVDNLAWASFKPEVENKISYKAFSSTF